MNTSDHIRATSSSSAYPEQPSPVRPSIVEKANVLLLEEKASELNPPTPIEAPSSGLFSNVTDATVKSRPSISSGYAEPPDVPDPFLVDEEETDDEDQQESTSTRAALQPGSASPGRERPEGPLEPELMSSQSPGSNDVQRVSPPDTQAQATIPIPLSSSGSPSKIRPNVNKDIPLPPPPVNDSDSEDEAEEVPEIFAPDLIRPAMFLPIPNTDPLTTLLNKYVPRVDDRPVRDLTGDRATSDFNTLVIGNNWRALAKMARDRIVSSGGEDMSLILGLWYLRLASLSRLRLFNQTAAECANLFTVLNSIEPQASRDFLFEKILPFELQVMEARLRYWAGEHMSYLDVLVELLNKSRQKARAETDPGLTDMWKERAARVSLIIASQLVEMKDLAGAAKLIEPLVHASNTDGNLRSAVGRIYLQAGNMAAAAKHFSAVEEDPDADSTLKDMNTALLASAQGEWEKADILLQRLILDDPMNFTAVNNRAVALLGRGQLQDGIDVLETALRTSPSTVVVAEPFLFNLSTLYELRSSTSIDMKRALLIEVARWSGDGLRTACLKLPTS